MPESPSFDGHLQLAKGATKILSSRPEFDRWAIDPFLEEPLIWTFTRQRTAVLPCIIFCAKFWMTPGCYKKHNLSVHLEKNDSDPRRLCLISIVSSLINDYKQVIQY